MQKTFMIAVVAAFVAATGFAVSNSAVAKSERGAKAQECAKITDAKKKKECLSKAGKGMATKADKAAKKEKGKK